MADFGFMANQKEINENMRAILIDWLIDVHLKFKLWSETLFLTINLIDRYLAATNVKKSDLQLIGVSCMLIASKYEEIYPPTLKDFVYICNSGFTAKDILATEQKVLFALDFDIKSHSQYRFLERYSKHAKLDPKAFLFAQYLLEIALLDYRTLKYKPSVHASAAIYISQKLFKNPVPWPENLVE
jgi:cyclin B